MSIMRSFTTRRKEPEFDPNTPNFLGRAASLRGGRPVPRTKISGPVALVSTTNMLSYNAPNIAGTQPVEQRDVSSSSEESDGSNGSVHSHETDPTDMSSPDASPTSAEPEPNHLSHYFKAAVDAAHKPMRSPSLSGSPILLDSPSPALPRRAPSHSKRAHEALSRKLSVQRARSPSAQGRGVSRTRNSADMFNSMATAFVEAPKDGSPQLDAVAEESGGSSTTLTEHEFDAMYLRTKNLAHVSAADYLQEINPYLAIYLDDSTPSVPDFSGWF